MSNLQKVRTDKYGELEVVQSFQEGPRVIHLLKNGAYVFDSGLPVTEASDLRRGIGKAGNFLAEALEWLEHKDDRVHGLIREIKSQRGTLVYADDGTPVNSVEDIISFYEPGPFREAAFAVYAAMVTGNQEAKMTFPTASPKPAATPRKAAVKTTTKASGKKATAKQSAAPKVKETAPETAAATA